MADTIFKKLRNSYLVDGKVISIRKLAPLIHIDNSKISELERGLRKPSKNELLKYHEFFNVPVDNLLGITAPAAPEINKEDVNALCPAATVAELSDWLSNSDKPDEILLRQTLELLTGTSAGLALLFYISEYLWGIEDISVKKGTYSTGEDGKLHVSSPIPLEDVAKLLVSRISLLRDPKYCKLSYNDIRIILAKVKSVDN